MANTVKGYFKKSTPIQPTMLTKAKELSGKAVNYARENPGKAMLGAGAAGFAAGRVTAPEKTAQWEIDFAPQTPDTQITIPDNFSETNMDMNFEEKIGMQTSIGKEIGKHHADM
jgi:hypothetical protein